MSTTSDGIQSFSAAKILIGPLQIEEQSNVLIPFNRCTVVAANGGIWDLNCNHFTATESRVRKLWDTDASHFTKREQ